MDKFSLPNTLFDKFLDIAEKSIFFCNDALSNNEVLIKSVLEVLRNRLLFLVDETGAEIYDREIGKVNLFYKINKTFISEEEKKLGGQNALKLLIEKGIEALYDINPGLESILLNATNRYIAFINEFLERFHKDEADIINTLFNGVNKDESIKLIKITSEAADLHNNNRATLIVYTNYGKLIYRPHDMKIDLFSYHFFMNYFSKWVYIPRAISKEKYGYSEFIDDDGNIDSITKAKELYHNIGGMAAIFVALGSKDCHVENILKKDDKPAIVDLETIIAPVIKREDIGILDYNYDLSNSIYVSGILPQKSDELQLSVLFNKDDINKLIPIIEGRKININEYNLLVNEYNKCDKDNTYEYNDFFEGFDEAYNYILDNKNNIINELKNVSDVNNRILLRNTNNYAELIKYTTKSYVTKSDNVYETLVKGLNPFGTKINNTENIKIAESEAKALVNADIPYFYCNNKDRDLYDAYGNNVKKDFFEKNGIENAICHINNMSMKESSFEKSMMKYIFLNAIEKNNEEIEGHLLEIFENAKTSYCEKHKNGACSKYDIDSIKIKIEEDIKSIYNSIVNNAVKSIHEQYLYFTLSEQGLSNRCMNMDFGNGYMGILLFLVGCNKYFGVNKLDKQAQEIFDGLIDNLDSYADIMYKIDTNIIANIPVGYSNGIGGIIKALAIIYSYTNNEKIFDICKKLVLMLNERYYPNESAILDMYGGISGLIYSLLSTKEVNNLVDPKLVKRLSDYLLSKKTLKYKDILLWDTLDRTWPISGYGHGISGVVVALNYAYNFLGDNSLRAAIDDGIYYEHNIYSKTLRSWPDLRDKEIDDNFMHGICSGAPGIGLSILSYIRNSRDFKNDILKEGILLDLGRAIDKCLDYDIMYRDNLCCGNMAVIEFLVELLSAIEKNNELLQFKSKINSVNQKINLIIQFMHERYINDKKYYLFYPKFTNIFMPSFLFGYSGIGYELLRTIDRKNMNGVFI